MSLLYPGGVRLRILKAEKLRQVQKCTVIFGEQDPFVQAVLVVGEDKYLTERDKTAKRLLNNRTEEIEEEESFLVKAAKTAAQYSAKVLGKQDIKWERTRTIKHGGKNPIWSKDARMDEVEEVDDWGRGSTLTFTYPGRDESILEKSAQVRILLKVMDEEAVGFPREIGATVIDIASILNDPQKQEVHSMELENNAGKIWFVVKYDAWEAVATRGVLRINVEEAQNLPRISSLKESKTPYCSFQLVPWNIRGRCQSLNNITDTSAKWSSGKGLVSLYYPGIKDKETAKDAIGLALKIQLYYDQLVSVSRKVCVGEAWIRLGNHIKAGVMSKTSMPETKSEEEINNKGNTTTINLYDPQNGAKRTAKILVSIDFEPFFTKETGAHICSNDVRQKKALIIGINYVQKDGELRGCHNDALEMQKLMQQKFGCDQIKLLLDTKDADKTSIPTADNIRNGLEWLRTGCSPGDLLFLHYSGHGSQVPDLNGDEEDGLDETLVPLDFDWEATDTHITDDELRSSFFEKIPKGVDLTVVFDCCHSGTMSDLKVVSSSKRSSVATASNQDNNNQNKGDRSRFLKPPKFVFEKAQQIQDLVKSKSGCGTRLLDTKRSSKSLNIKKDASIVVISGCRDDQTAADAHIDGKFMGATTWSIHQVMRESKEIFLGSFIENVREKISSRGWAQVPQLSLGYAKTDQNVWFQYWENDSSSRVVKAQESSDVKQAKQAEKENESTISDQSKNDLGIQSTKGPETETSTRSLNEISKEVTTESAEISRETDRNNAKSMDKMEKVQTKPKYPWVTYAGNLDNILKKKYALIKKPKNVGVNYNPAPKSNDPGLDTVLCRGSIAKDPNHSTNINQLQNKRLFLRNNRVFVDHQPKGVQVIPRPRKSGIPLL